MTSTYRVIFEEFEEELAAIESLVAASSDPKSSRPRVRVAGANAALLLLAATFEEFVRELARAYARFVVESCASYDDLPPRLASTAWKRTMDALARLRLNPKKELFSRESIFSDALTSFTIVHEFCRGNLTKNIYQELIHNENNMRPQEINSLFKISGLNNICYSVCLDTQLLDMLNQIEQGKAHSELVERLEGFFERRNQVAHSIAAMRSSGTEQISSDIELFRRFGYALYQVLEN
jgi:hypothetical protein